jgi:predicted AAA+ superfamily ATPase
VDGIPLIRRPASVHAPSPLDPPEPGFTTLRSPRIYGQGREFRPGTPEFGEAFETVLFHELIAHRDYVSGEPLAYWRSTSGFEVDFLIGDHTAIEAKATPTLSPSDVKSLAALAEEKSWKRLYCVCLEPRRRTIGEVIVLPWREFFDALWAGELS